MRLLVVEDERKLGDLVERFLSANRFLIDRAATLADAIDHLEMTDHALVVLDRRLPDGDSLSLLPRIRALRPGIRILILTAFDAVDDRVLGLESGADDYLTKPFAMAELLARIRALLRRPVAETPRRTLVCGLLSYDLDRREASVRDASLLLPRRELGLLELLIRRAGRVVLRETLTDALYGIDDDIQSNALDVQVSRLRRRLQDAEAGISVVTVRGVGYMMGPAS